MIYEPLHHKYRPQTFGELVGQGAIATTLSNALTQQRIAPAYLFTGARGTGKTSSARIFAKSLNCLQSDVPTDKPCGVCEVCRTIANGSALDVIEIDAASNTGVDNIRELIERAQFAPVQCRYKVYVLDEVHMLTGQAFNALLKTLEEPPDRVVFVLATTDPQRVLPTIISRCQRFDFRRIPLEEIVKHLGAIALKENISTTPDALQLIAQISQGGLRDAESLLDQLSLQDQITVERVWDLVGAVPERDLLALVRAIAQDQPAAVLDQARHLMDRGREPLIVLQNFASFYRDLLIAKTAPNRNDLAAMTPPTWAELCEFAQDFDLSWILAGQKHLRTSEVQVKHTTQPRLWLEVILLGLLPSAIGGQPSAAQPAIESQRSAARSQQPTPVRNSLSQQSAVNQSAILESPLPSQTPLENPVDEVIQTVEAVSQLASQPAESISESFSSIKDIPEQPELNQTWQEVLKHVEPRGTQMLLRQHGRLVAFNGQEAQVHVIPQWYGTVKDRLNRIEAAFQVVFQGPVKVRLEASALQNVHHTSEQSVAPTDSTAPAGQPEPTLQSPVSLSQMTPPLQPPIKADFPTANLSQEVHSPPSDQPPHSQTSVPSDLGAPQWQEEDEVMKAAKSLAQMFNGQIVSLEDDIEVGQSVGEMPPNAIDLGLRELSLDDDEDDIPF